MLNDIHIAHATVKRDGHTPEKERQQNNVPMPGSPITSTLWGPSIFVHGCFPSFSLGGGAAGSARTKYGGVDPGCRSAVVDTHLGKTATGGWAVPSDDTAAGYER